MTSLIEYVEQLSLGMGQTNRFGLTDSQLDPAKIERDLSSAGLPGLIFDCLYSKFNGQKGPLCLFGEYRLLAIEEAFDQSKDYAENFSDEPSESNDSRIRGGLLWRNLWFPFAWDQNNNRILVIDFDPSAKGSFGQVWVYDCRDAIGAYFLSNSWEEFLSSRFAQIEASGFETDGDEQFISKVIPFT